MKKLGKKDSLDMILITSVAAALLFVASVLLGTSWVWSILQRGW
jgi:hypothetical protein